MTSSTPLPLLFRAFPDRKLVVFPGKPGEDCWCLWSEVLTGMCSRGLASPALMSYPSRGTCSILPLWANSRCIPGATGRTSGRGVGPTGAGVTVCSIPEQESRVLCSGATGERSVTLEAGKECSHVTHTEGCVQARSGCWGSPGRCRPHTSIARCWRGTAWTCRRRVRHTEGRTDRRPAEDGRKRKCRSRRWRSGRSLCGAHTRSSAALGTHRVRHR